jgi:hypothetical protein
VSENFIEASREKVKQLMERPLGQLHLCAVLIDGTPFKDRQMIVALGIGCDGRKTVLGLREGATENAAVVSALLSELVERGLDFATPRFYILDAAKRCMRRSGVMPAGISVGISAIARLVGVSWATLQYKSRKEPQEPLRRRLRELASTHARYGIGG